MVIKNKTYKTNWNNRSTYTYQFTNDKGEIETIEIKPGEDGVTEVDIKMLHAMDDREVYNNNKNLRPNLTQRDRDEILEWEKLYIKNFISRHGYTPDKTDFYYAKKDYFRSRYNISLDYELDTTDRTDKNKLFKDISEKILIENENPEESVKDILEQILTPSQLEVIWLNKILGYSLKEIAKMRETSPASITKMKQRAEEKIEIYKKETNY